MKRKLLPSALRPLAGPPGTAARGPGKPPSSTPKTTPRHTPAMAQKNGSFFYKVVMTVVVTLLFSGLFGCGGTGKSEEIVSFYTSSYEMARNPEYAFALYRQDGVWYPNLNSSGTLSPQWKLHWLGFLHFLIFYKAETLGLQYSRSPPGSLCSLNFRN